MPIKSGRTILVTMLVVASILGAVAIFQPKVLVAVVVLFVTLAAASVGSVFRRRRG
jgi:hypothetical protein